MRPVPRPASPPRAFRPEIQGLRALAVTAVVVHHAWPDLLPGGFVGVDVFFVVSGFLITGHLAREAEGTGRIDVLRFWAGRVRRLMPAALVTVLVTVLLATLLLPAASAAATGRAAVAASLGAANLWFAATAVDYAATEAVGSPLLHLWSLGVEEQVYALLPLVLLGGALLARRAGRRPRPVLVATVAVLAAASFAVGTVRAADGAPSAYFLPDGRAWELLAGGLLALLLRGRSAAGRPATALQAAGLAAIGLAAWLFTGATPMPGAPALLPVLGTLAVLAAGDPPGTARVWRLRAVRWLGDRSYSLYLWHWPLLAFAAALLPGAAPAVAGCVLVSLLLAEMSHRLVESPLRRRIRLGRPARVLAAGLTAAALVAAAGTAPVSIDAARSAERAALRAAVLAPPTAGLGWPALAEGAAWAKTPHAVVPDPSAAGDDVFRHDCTTSPRSTRLARCTLGDARSATVVALAGDSHAFQWLPVLDRLGRTHGWRVETFLQNSCPFSALPRRIEVEGLSHCTVSVAHALDELRALRPAVVVTSAWRGSYPGRAEQAAGAFRTMWDVLRVGGARVIAVEDTPAPTRVPTAAECAGRDDPAACGRTRRAALDEPDPVRLAAAASGTTAVDPADAFCTPARCPAVVGNLLVYRDDNHVGATYMRSVVPWAERVLAPVIGAATASGAT